MIWAMVSSWSCFCWLYRPSPSLAANNIINLISVSTIWWCPCVVFSCVVGIRCLLWTVRSLGRTLLAFAPLHSVLQGHICLLLQVFLDFCIPVPNSLIIWLKQLLSGSPYSATVVSLSGFTTSPWKIRERFRSQKEVRRFFFLFLRVSSYKKSLTSVLKIKSAIKMIQMFAIKTRKTIKNIPNTVKVMEKQRLSSVWSWEYKLAALLLKGNLAENIKSF